MYLNDQQHISIFFAKEKKWLVYHLNGAHTFVDGNVNHGYESDNVFVLPESANVGPGDRHVTSNEHVAVIQKLHAQAIVMRLNVHELVTESVNVYVIGNVTAIGHGHYSYLRPLVCRYGFVRRYAPLLIHCAEIYKDDMRMPTLVVQACGVCDAYNIIIQVPFVRKSISLWFDDSFRE